ncbi:MAG: hypothetical protein ACKVRP_04110 [Bacteroidota bacterium]
MAGRRSHSEEVVSTLPDVKDRDRFTNARLLLKQHLIHTREVSNGKDYLFAGPRGQLLVALKDLRDLEQRCSRFLQFDYAEVEEYFLLRIVSLSQHQEIIETYFE